MAMLDDMERNFNRIQREIEAQNCQAIQLEGDNRISVCYYGKTNKVSVAQHKDGKILCLNFSITDARTVHKLLGELLQRDTD